MVVEEKHLGPPGDAAARPATGGFIPRAAANFHCQPLVAPLVMDLVCHLRLRILEPATGGAFSEALFARKMYILLFGQKCP